MGVIRVRVEIELEDDEVLLSNESRMPIHSAQTEHEAFRCLLNLTGYQLEDALRMRSGHPTQAQEDRFKRAEERKRIQALLKEKM